MRRREFIAGLGSAVAWPLVARGQQRALPVVGYLNPGAADGDPLVAAFRLGLNEAGYIEGRNLEILFRYGENQSDRLRSMASDMVRRRVAVIFAAGGFAANAAKEATRTIPIVCEFAYDPVAAGLVASLNRPGGNVTGASRLVEASITKGLEFFHELMPKVGSVALMRAQLDPLRPTMTLTIDRSNQIGRRLRPASPGNEDRLLQQVSPDNEAKNATQTLGLELMVAPVSSMAEIEQSVAQIARRSAGLLFDASPLFINQIDQVVALTALYRVPAVYSWREASQAGGLMSYGGSFHEVMRIASSYVARILKGEKPADLPVWQATRLELSLNLKTAKELGLTVPPTLLAIADEVIE
jgi:putative tryptophan/tyrosine transport system substrate-binding protein